MFKDWTDDSEQVLKRFCMKDVEYSKIGRFVKDYFEYTRLTDVLKEYAAAIKDIFTYCIAFSTFPSISWIDFTNLCSMWKIPDSKTCTMQTIDRIFIVTNVELMGQEQEDNPDRDLCRYEFFEIIVRMGGAKFKDSKEVDTWDEATKLLLEKHMIPNTNHMGG